MRRLGGRRGGCGSTQGPTRRSRRSSIPPSSIPQAFDPDVIEAHATMIEQAAGVCEWPEVEVEAWEYDYFGLKGEVLSVETWVFSLTNTGSEYHELVIFEVSENAEGMSIRQILELPDWQDYLTRKGSASATSPSQTGLHSRRVDARSVGRCVLHPPRGRRRKETLLGNAGDRRDLRGCRRSPLDARSGSVLGSSPWSSSVRRSPGCPWKRVARRRCHHSHACQPMSTARASPPKITTTSPSVQRMPRDVLGRVSSTNVATASSA